MHQCVSVNKSFIRIIQLVVTDCVYIMLLGVLEFLLQCANVRPFTLHHIVQVLSLMLNVLPVVSMI